MQTVAQNPAAAPKLENTVFISGGRVRRVEEWVNTNGVEGGGWFHIERQGQNSFVCSFGSDEYGGGTLRGTLSQALEKTHKSFHSGYIALFNLEGLTQENAAAQVARVLPPGKFRRFKVSIS